MDSKMMTIVAIHLASYQSVQECHSWSLRSISNTCQEKWNYYYHEAVDPWEPNLITKVRISIGASSTTSFWGSTGPPLNTFGSSWEPSTFQTNLFLSISSLPWFADKLISSILCIWMVTFKGSIVSLACWMTWPEKWKI